MSSCAIRVLYIFEGRFMLRVSFTKPPTPTTHTYKKWDICFGSSLTSAYITASVKSLQFAVINGWIFKGYEQRENGLDCISDLKLAYYLYIYMFVKEALWVGGHLLPMGMFTLFISEFCARDKYVASIICQWWICVI